VSLAQDSGDYGELQAKKAGSGLRAFSQQPLKFHKDSKDRLGFEGFGPIDFSFTNQ